MRNSPVPDADVVRQTPVSLRTVTPTLPHGCGVTVAATPGTGYSQAPTASWKTRPWIVAVERRKSSTLTVSALDDTVISRVSVSQPSPVNVTV